MNDVSEISARSWLMGSPFVIKSYYDSGWSETKLHQIIELAFAEIARIEDLLTDFKSSPFQLINDHAGIRPVQINREILELILQSLQISRDSDGAFDISYASIGHLWRDKRKTGEIPSEAEIQEAKEFVDYTKIEIDEMNQTIFLPHKKMKIGLGGIGKGYAVDKAYEVLRNYNLKNFYINGAGDIRVHTSRDAPRPWKIAIRNPLSQTDEALGILHLSAGAIATSGDYERFFRHEGKKYHHIFNPKTGKNTEEIVSTTVLGPTAMSSDVCATTAMTLGMKKGIEFLNHRRNLTGFMMRKDGKTAFCSNWKNPESFGNFPVEKKSVNAHARN